MLWRAFVGEPDERMSLDVTGVPWAEARRVLLEALAEDYPADGPVACEHCDSAMRAAMQGLDELQPETPGEWDVDRDTYALWEWKP